MINIGDESELCEQTKLTAKYNILSFSSLSPVGSIISTGEEGIALIFLESSPIEQWFQQRKIPKILLQKQNLNKLSSGVLEAGRGRAKPW